MTRFLQAHILTSYPPSNPNRDELGRPKTCTVGGVQRQRISSQALKRTWRTSEVFQAALGNEVGIRVADLFGTVREALKRGGVKDTDANKWAEAIANDIFGAKEVTKGNRGTVLTYLDHHERKAIQDLTAGLAARVAGPTEDELGQLRTLGKQVSADVALFGRMVADKTSRNIDAALQVGQAFTVNEARLDNDYWTGKRDVDPDDFFDHLEDLNTEGGDGATIIGDAEMGSGLYYLYLCVNWDQLVKSTGDEEAARKAVRALLTAAVLLAPAGKATQHAHQARARYVMLEDGKYQPRTLAAAFEDPVRETDLAREARNRLESYRANLAKVYGDDTEERHFYVGPDGAEGSLDEVLELV